jgi:tRNA-specific 2-thiouridylase
VAHNVLYVDQDTQSPYLMSRRLWTESAHWVAGSPPAGRFACTAQTRYRQPDEPCQVDVRDDGTVAVEFTAPQRAVTPGQSLVLYDGDECLGGAVIARTDAPLEMKLAEQAA